jgi:hypothetical protein
MRRARAEQVHTVQGTAGVARLAPTQKRSRERFEKILGCAEELLLEKGGDALPGDSLAGFPQGPERGWRPSKPAVLK